MSAPIFISYSSKDQQIAETIYQALEARGLDCWIASRDVRAGENFQEAIVRALRSAKVMLLVFTSNANNSDEIKKELVLAGRHRVTVVPVRVEDVVPNDAFTYELATRQWIDLFKDWERQIELLASRLGQILQTANSHEAGGAAAACGSTVVKTCCQKVFVAPDANIRFGAGGPVGRGWRSRALHATVCADCTWSRANIFANRDANSAGRTIPTGASSRADAADRLAPTAASSNANAAARSVTSKRSRRNCVG